MKKIYEAIPKIMAEMEAITKDKTNKQQGFKYRGIDDFYIALQKRMAKEGIFTVPEVLESNRTERASKTGGVLSFVQLKVSYKVYASDGSFIEGVVMGEAMDSGDKAFNKAMSVAHKYFFIQTFCIPTDDAIDPDAESHEILPTAKKYKIIDGKYAGKSFDEIPKAELLGYIASLNSNLSKLPEAQKTSAELIIREFTKWENA